MRTAFWTYLWDIAEQDPGRVMDWLRDDIGINTLYVSATYHRSWVMPARNRGRHLFVIDDNVAFFHPELHRYQEAGIAPRVSPWLQGRHLERIATECRARGMAIGVWVGLAFDTRIASERPHWAVVDAWGVTSTGSICINQPGVRSYAMALVGDVGSNYDVDWVILEQFGFRQFEPPTTHDKLPFSLDAAVEWLLSVCFCRSCVAWAAEARFDIEAARHRVRELLEAARNGEDLGGGGALAAIVAEDQALAAFQRGRTEAVRRLVEEVRGACPVPLRYLHMHSPLLTGADPTAITQLVPEAELVTWTPPEVTFRAAIESHLRLSGQGPSRLSVMLDSRPAAALGPDFLNDVRAAVELSLGGISFYNYSLTPRPAMDRVRDACAMVQASA